jgi:hypothetical protein
MTPRVYLQRVTVYWTRRSRGMPDAAKRNSCKISFPISDDEIKILTAGEGYSDIRIHESLEFTPQRTTGEFWQPGKLDFDTLSIKRPSGKTIVRYRYSTLFVGAPARSNRPDISCEIQPGELVRVEYNGRFAYPMGDWSYHRVIYNIVYTDRLTTDSFLAEPDHYIQDMANLL